MFRSEEELVSQFVDLLSRASSFGLVQVLREFFYARGKTDVVAISDGLVIAFEAKLTDWKTALHQACRNTCFAHGSYVLLPKITAFNALRFSAEFEERGVGLCYVDGEELVVLKQSSINEPLEPWLATKAVAQAVQWHALPSA